VFSILNIMSELATVLRRRRETAGLSLRETAGLIGISPAYLVALEQGRNPSTGRPPAPSPRVLAGIGAALGIAPDALLRLAVAPGTGAHVLLVRAADTRRPVAAAAGRAAGREVAVWLELAAARAGDVGPALAAAGAGRTAGDVGLIFGAGANPFQRDEPAAVLARERTWEADVSTALGAAPAANVCVYRLSDLHDLADPEPLDAVLALVAAHPRVALEDDRAAICTGPAAIEGILRSFRPPSIGDSAWRSLTAAAALGLHGTSPAERLPG
jgi:transcriptional regulator with XRE-family HTH domain